MNSESNPVESVTQLPLFGGLQPEPVLEEKRLPGRRTVDNPYLRAARRLSKQIRRLPGRSAEETQTGLAICRALKAYLEDPPDRTH